MDPTANVDQIATVPPVLPKNNPSVHVPIVDKTANVIQIAPAKQNDLNQLSSLRKLCNF